MKKSDFYFKLPEELIAQTPLYPRDSSRLLFMEKETGILEDKQFTNIVDLLNTGDLLVLNNSRVIPARLYGHREDTGGALEVLLLSQRGNDTWEIMAKPGKRATKGNVYTFGDGLLRIEILDELDGGNKLVKFYYQGNIFNVLDKIGEMPLPHYITEKLKDNERYQTVYSKELGSAAAPTAGLHFTPELLERIKAKGINIAYVTLHVGLGTFRPVKVDDITDHTMHSEEYFMSQETADLINLTKSNGKKVIAVGTTSCRTLESVATFNNGNIISQSGSTNIFIYPGYTFKVIDGLITNFHLPESTLIMLVSALAGYENTMNCYKHAVDEKYRFYSFGDAMFIGDWSDKNKK